MKNLFLLLCLVGFLSCKNESDAPKNPDALPAETASNPYTVDGKNENLGDMGRLVFTDTLHDFGVLTEGETVQYEFEYTNVGKKDVVIAQCSSSCGCTIPEYKNDPIKPGEKGTLNVKFNSTGKDGDIHKIVNIVTTGSPSNLMIAIQAKVNKK
jgi:hypothetical protein